MLAIALGFAVALKRLQRLPQPIPLSHQRLDGVGGFMLVLPLCCGWVSCPQPPAQFIVLTHP
jgi:hypothetical protein